MSKPKFYRHEPTGEIFMRMCTKEAANCFDGSPKLVCLNDGLFWADSSTFGVYAQEFTELNNPAFYASNQVSVNL
jgi:hypothetical protein